MSPLDETGAVVVRGVCDFSRDSSLEELRYVVCRVTTKVGGGVKILLLLELDSVAEL